MSISTREWQLVRRPHGEPVAEDFRLVTMERPDPADGEVVVQTIAMSVDPYMRGRMSAAKSYAASWELGETMQGGTVGQVVASRSDAVPEGALVLHGQGWRDVAVVPAKHVSVVEPLPGLPLSLYLGVLGMPGLTAYAGLFRLADFREGDAVFVSGAAGAVGSLVGQFARLRGASRVVGSAGTPEKVRWLQEELGFSAAFDYHDGKVADLLGAAAPDGIDVFFDNVGGEHLEAAIGGFRTYGRAALCGSISGYNATTAPPGPRNLGFVVGKQLTLRGFIVGDHADLRPEFVGAVSGWLQDGSLVARETVVDGLDSAVDAFRALLSGGNTGKMVVRLAPDPS
ncbi:NADP-dependent oxidoreductase [Modestobacter sp. VKM Ac-2979]|uniref:NADP-dependent oxidoreductase n=1 Tax=unclassified Modestobacter TaxID=2643866 RepID=UPI0022AB8101|nr:MULTISPECIES: NADP-dependent oxidoreductase [unclassified Modestobacter]MCZ2810795.1 NADP-dependent oxidoreductase [Modestobacter sp. VKM Ac-2979]MCZ2840308.1 NADP-dependent oxidoreductase [Modestobacter sp. VKM Ac-2980]